MVKMCIALFTGVMHVKKSICFHLPHLLGRKVCALAFNAMTITLHKIGKSLRLIICIIELGLDIGRKKERNPIRNR